MAATNVSRRRVVVTGVGAVSTAGSGRMSFFAGICGGTPDVTSRTGQVREVTDWDPSSAYDNPKDARRSDRVEQFAMAAAVEALKQAGQPVVAPDRIGVSMGVGLGGVRTYEETLSSLREKGPRSVSPLTVPAIMPNAAAAAIARRFDFTGQCETVSLACASGTHAIGNAYRMIAWGVCDAVVAGGAESLIAPAATVAFLRTGAVSASGVSRPFDCARDGFVMSEGAAVLVLEDLESAHRRGAVILAEVLGFAANSDAYHITSPSPGGRGAIACMRAAVADAALDPSAIVCVNAHGTATHLNDETEATAIGEVFGPHGVAVTSIKGATGHALGAAGALEAASVILSFTERLLPPTLNTHDVPQDFKIDLVCGAPRDWEPGPTISNSFAFGGHNASVVFAPLN
jgi:3-oxoacyl-[acyl-carrier-protein] synthase II